MIILRQKIFFLPALLNVGMLGMTGAQMVQSSQQADEAEEQNRQQIRATKAVAKKNSEDAARMRETQEKIGKQQAAIGKQQVKAMNKIAKAAKDNPMVAHQFMDQMQGGQQPQQAAFSNTQKQFAAINSQTLNTAKGFVNDLRKFAWGKRKQVANGLAMGAAIAGSSAVVDKMIQKDIKKNNLPFLDQQQQNQQKQFALVNPQTIQKGQQIVRNGINYTGKEFLNQFKFNPFAAKGKKKYGLLMTGGFAAMPAIEYMADKAQYKNQVGSTTPQQRQYANVGSAMKCVSNFFKNWKKEGIVAKPLETASKFMGQSGKDMAKEFQTLGAQSGNKWTQGVGNFLSKHKKTASIGGLAVGGGIMSAGWGNGEKYTKKAIESVDKNAFAYEKSKNQQIPK